MPDKRNHFNSAAVDAANARNAAQAELARQLADELVADPERFDPKRLGMLGTVGFKVLLAIVRRQEVDEPPPRRYDRPEHADARAAATSWSDLRRAEPNRWFGGVAMGIAAGLIIIALGYAIATFS